MKYRILITGGMGFVGGRLAQHLHKAGYQILLGSRTAQSSPNWLPEAEVVKMAWNDFDALGALCARVDRIIHAAGMNAYDSAADPAGALAFNGVATARLLNAGIKARVKRFVYLSTAHVYGSPLAGVITEETCPTSLHPYATSHRAGEDMVRAAHQRSEIEGVVIRLSNTYGAPAYSDKNSWMLLVNDLCRQAAENRSLVLRSSGLQRRDFVPLSDVCRAVEHLLDKPLKDIGDGLFNVGGECAMTVWDMAQRIVQCCHETLGYMPKITRSDSELNEKDIILEYNINKLKSTGFSIEGDGNAEIIQTLRMCAAESRSKMHD